MSDINKREFTELALDGGNYLTWALDVEIHLASCDLHETIVSNSKSSPAQKAKALIFLRHHLNKDLKNEYLTEKDPIALWQSLKDRFDQQTTIILPQAQFDWLNLRFQDFKSVTEYNSALHRIVSQLKQLKLCKQKVTETELIEKTLSTFHASNLVLQQQYRAKTYTKHSELISALLVAEKHNQLLMKNHNARPVGSQPVPEAHATSRQYNNRRGQVRGRGHMSWSQRGGRGWSQQCGRGRGYNNVARFQGHDKRDNIKPHFHKAGPSQQAKDKQQVCHRCGCDGHWSRTCRTPKHLIEAYQRVQKDKKGKGIQGESHLASLPEVNLVLNDNDDDDLLKLELEDYGDQQ